MDVAIDGASTSGYSLSFAGNVSMDGNVNVLFFFETFSNVLLFLAFPTAFFWEISSWVLTSKVF